MAKLARSDHFEKGLLYHCDHLGAEKEHFGALGQNFFRDLPPPPFWRARISGKIKIIFFGRGLSMFLTFFNDFQ